MIDWNLMEKKEYEAPIKPIIKSKYCTFNFVESTHRFKDLELNSKLDPEI